MIEIKPSALYTRADLAEMLAPVGIDADGWIRLIRPVKRFRGVWFGEDLIEAIRLAPPMNEKLKRELPEKCKPGNRRKRGAVNGELDPLLKLMR